MLVSLSIIITFALKFLNKASTLQETFHQKSNSETAFIQQKTNN